MFRFLVIAFLIVPIIEIYLIIQVGGAIGGWNTIGLLVLDSIIGAWLVRREGFSILAQVQMSLAKGKAPTNELIDGMLVLFAGALMLTPGFLTDGLGLLLLIPPTRAVVRNAVKGRLAGRVQIGGFGPGGFGGFGRRQWTDADSAVVDDDPHDDPDDDPPGAIELGPISD